MYIVCALILQKADAGQSNPIGNMMQDLAFSVSTNANVNVNGNLIYPSLSIN